MNHLFRKLPLAALTFLAAASSASAQFGVTPEQYGATPNDPSDDDRKAIQDAIDGASVLSSLFGTDASVVFQANATYHVNSEGPNSPASCCPAAFYIDSYNFNGTGQPFANRTLTLDGNNAKIVSMKSDLRMFLIRNSNNVTVEDLELDVDPLPYMDAIIQSVVPATRRVTVTPVRGIDDATLFGGFPFSGPTEFGWTMEQSNPGTPQVGALTNFFASNFTQSAPGADMSFTVFTPHFVTADFTVGTPLTYHIRKGNSFNGANVTNLTLRNITSYGSGLFFLAGDRLTNFTATRCNVLVAPGRWRSNNGDGIHLDRSSNVVIEGCVFVGLSDDAIHLKRVEGFRIEACRVAETLRHAILLDGDDVPFNSTNGLIKNNLFTLMGGSPLYHLGGDYSSVVFKDNITTGNLQSAFVGDKAMRAVFRSAVTDALALSVGTDAGVLGEFDNLQLAAPGPLGTEWDLLMRASGTGAAPAKHLMASRLGRDSNDWFYISPEGAAVAGASVEVAGPSAPIDPVTNPNLIPSINGDEQFWNFELVGGTYYRIKHRDTQLYLTGDPSSGGLVAGDPVMLAPLIADPNSARLQIWRREMLDE